MSREIRRVPVGWQHPTNGHYPSGEIRYVPLYDRSNYWRHVESAREEGEPDPDPDAYMPAWPEGSPLGWCLYETTSEGTPVGPVLPSEEALADWLVSSQGMSRRGAEEFIRRGWAPSFVRFKSGPLMDGLTAVDRLSARNGN